MAHIISSYGVILFTFFFGKTFLLISVWNWCTPSWSNLGSGGGGGAGWCSGYKAVCLKSRDRGFVPRSGIQVSEKQNFLSRSLVKITRKYCVEHWILHDWEVACSGSDRQGSNFESYVWRAVWSYHLIIRRGWFGSSDRALVCNH